MAAAVPRTRRGGRGARRIAGERWIVAGAEAIVGIGAVFGGYGLLSDAEGMGAKQEWLDGSVFPDYTVPGLVLLVVIGGGMLCAAGITLLERRQAPVAAGLMAVVLLAWGLTETLTIGWRGWQQVLLVAAFVLLPAAVLGSYCLRGRRAR
jgi:hypothetical protein